MTEEKVMRLSQVARVLNVGVPTVISHLSAKGFKVDNNPNTKINAEQLEFLSKDFKSDALLGGSVKKEEAPAPPKIDAEDNPIRYFRSNATAPVQPEAPLPKEVKPVVVEVAPIETPSIGLKVVGKIDLDAKPSAVAVPPPAPKPVAPPVVEVVEAPKPVVVPPPAPVAETPKPEPVVEPAKPAAPAPEPKAEAPAVVVPEPPAVVAPVVVETPAPVVAPPAPKAELPKKQETPVAAAKPTTTPRPVEAPKPVVEAPKPVVEAPKVVEPIEPELIEAKGDQLKGLTILGKIQLPSERKPNDNKENDKKRKRKRVRKGEKVSDTPNARPAGANPNNRTGTGTPPPARTGTGTPPARTGTGTPPPARTGTGTPPANGAAPSTGTAGANKKGGRQKTGRRDEISAKDVTDSIKATNARLSGTTSGKNFGADKRRERRRTRAEAAEERALQEQEDAKILKVTEFISANDLSSLMDVPVNEVIGVCLSMGMFVSINQRLDAESITLIADEFGFDVEFRSAEEEVKADVVDEVDAEEDLQTRAPIVTIMGHVDHGKTSLLDYVRRTKVAAGEAGGITQHIGAYSVKTDSGRQIAFLDTPGHEAFTAMRARGAKVTDVVIIVIAADDSIMPQTREAINHAQLANVPIVFAFSKIDKPGANTEKIREALAQMNILVEEWGGKYQTQEISSKSGQGINDLLEKVLLESDLLELKANPDRRATGTVIEASLDKGRGYLTTVLVQNGTLRIGDMMLAGALFGKVKAMFNSRGERIKEVGPSMPVQLLGLTGAPQAGDKFNIMENERDAREIANKREQILREQNLRTRKHITLEEIGRRKAIGTFKELNVIVKGDVDGSVEALSDSLLKLTTEEIQVNIIHKAVGQISESDINLAITSDAVVVGFQVRPSSSAKKLAEQEQIEIRFYSIIYDAINDVKDAMAGMLEPTVEEVIMGSCEVREVFKITKVGTVAGCYVLDGVIKRNNKIRVVRDFIVVHEGDVSALKRYKDDAADVRAGFECGLSIRGFNDIQAGDILESFELKEVKRSL
ncbi:MAG: translation initiation factor IF-2 [Runella slithyformis]|nr:MAG: translation initiation factor IF-2 [Runella slithyformis]TAF25315.1 MAG: translation initiation factor IF-2 [Runella slithyformis]TAF43659.1 MAG: translation initiation factor IF-2 [Runella slithyformis]